MKKILNHEGMKGTNYKAVPETVLKIIDEQLLEHGLEVVYYARNEEIYWKFEKRKAVGNKDGVVHKGGATIRSVSLG